MATLSPLDRYAFDTRGFLLWESVLPAATVGALRAAIATQELPPAGTTIESQRFGWHGELLAWHPSFRDLIDHPLVAGVLAEFIGPMARLDHAYGIVMGSGTSGLGIHGPAWPFDPAQYYVHRAGAIRSGLLSFSWSLTDGRPGAGGFGCIPGSHRSDEPVPSGAEALIEEIPSRPARCWCSPRRWCTAPCRGRAARTGSPCSTSTRPARRRGCGRRTCRRRPPAPCPTGNG